MSPARVDDRIVLSVDGTEVFSFTYGLPPGQGARSRPYIVVEALVQIPDDVMARIAGQTVTIDYVDVYGVVGSASPIYIVHAR